jgi:hypothetical protein
MADATDELDESSPPPTTMGNARNVVTLSPPMSTGPGFRFVRIGASRTIAASGPRSAL